jgi:mono/diheme cytochrome c family protein
VTAPSGARKAPATRCRRWTRAALALLAAGGIVALAGCESRPGRVDATVEVAGGDPAQGPGLMRAYGCIACHTIPGVRGADTWVGPPLTDWSRRVYIAGLVPNNPENLVAWLHNPHLIHEQSAMPNMGVSMEHARHMAAYLFTIR